MCIFLMYMYYFNGFFPFPHTIPPSLQATFFFLQPLLPLFMYKSSFNLDDFMYYFTLYHSFCWKGLTNIENWRPVSVLEFVPDQEALHSGLIYETMAFGCKIESWCSLMIWILKICMKRISKVQISEFDNEIDRASWP